MQVVVDVLSERMRWEEKNSDTKIVAQELKNNDLAEEEIDSAAVPQKSELWVIDKAIDGIIEVPQNTPEVKVSDKENDVRKEYEIKEIYATTGQQIGTYIYMSTALNLEDKKNREELQTKISYIPTWNDVYIRPIWEEIDTDWLLIWWGYICSLGHEWYRQMIDSLLTQENPSDRLRSQIMSYGIAQDISNFKDCFVDDANRGLILHRSKSKNIHRFRNDTVIELVRVLPLTK